jgi:hypothetical protein
MFFTIFACKIKDKAFSSPMSAHVLPINTDRILLSPAHMQSFGWQAIKARRH